MYKNKTFIGLIPARGGSKGLPGKNIRPLCGRPLIAWTIARAKESLLLDRVCVTTDDQQIASVAKEWGADVPFLRPAELAVDTAPTLGAVDHALNFYATEMMLEFDGLLLLEPTSPLRDHGDIDTMVQRLVDRWDEFDAVISIGQISEHPSIVKRKREETLEAYCPDLAPTTRRQDNAPAYFPYGVGYLVKTSALRDERTFYPKRATYFEIKRHQNYEIDDIYDFKCVEAVMKYEWNLK